VPGVKLPPVAAHVTEAPGTALPDLSVTLAVSSVLLPATTATESALALPIAVAGPAVVVTDRFAADTATMPPVNVDVRTVSLSVQTVVATPDEFVVLVVGLAIPPPVETVHVIVTPAAG